MKVLVFGALNIDKTYKVEHFVGAGETLSADSMNTFCGGKGFNQAVAFGKAKSDVYFAGAIGADGEFLVDELKAAGVDPSYVLRKDDDTGHAIIQITPNGENCIMIFAGTNGKIEEKDVDSILSHFEAGDIIVLQNEISSLGYIIKKSKEIGLTIAFNPSPFNSKITDEMLRMADYLFINEVEGEMITGATDPDEMLNKLRSTIFGNVVLTLGKNGSCYMDRNGLVSKCGIYETNTVDTTAAGDTYTGFFLSAIARGLEPEKAQRQAAIASGIAISREGAGSSIPTLEEVLNLE